VSLLLFATRLHRYCSLHELQTYCLLHEQTRATRRSLVALVAYAPNSDSS